MSQIKQDDDGDYEIKNNKFSLATGTEEVRQKLKQVLRFFLGEWFLDLLLGIPYHQLIFVKGTPATLIDDIYKGQILGTRGVSGLNDYVPLDFDPKTRDLNLNFEVSTPSGKVELPSLSVP